MGEETREPFDAIVIGSGFGGAVTAARLVEAGLEVCLLERGRRFEAGDFPEAPSPEQVLPDFARWRWAPKGGELGLWETRDLGDLLSVQAAGYGGGSLIYANVHLRAPEDAFDGWPEGWGRKALDPYYDLVAQKIGLEVAPDEVRDTEGNALPIVKAEQMKRASEGLGRPWVKLPIAVRFGDDGRTKERGRCVGCGACDTGCSYGAKKTLDQNYLEVVDRAASDPKGARRVEVLTLAEAVRIEPGPGEEPFTVHYRDHLTLEGEYGRGYVPVRSLRAKHVFVCAGALGSTELLGRSAHERLKGVDMERLGEGFRANADSLGVIYDTAEAQQPHVGPTITGGMVYNGPSVVTQHGATPEPEAETALPGSKRTEGADVFLLVEDGGYSLPVVGGFQAVFRSPLWLGRNRFDERPEDQRPAFGSSGGSVAVELPSGGRPNAALPVALYRVLVANQLSPELRRIMGEQLERLKARGGPRYEQEESAVIDAVLAAMAAKAPDILAERYRWLGWLFELGFLRRFASRAAASLLEVAKPTIIEVFREAMIARYGLGDPGHLAGTAIRLAAGDRSASFVVADPDAPAPPTGPRAGDHVAVLLSMGRDHGSGKVEVPSPTEGGPTRVRLELPRGMPVYATQEALLRDVAGELKGELRLNPDWSTNRRPVTVHAQGGCAMADTPGEGVTDGNGQVHGVPGLYVFDASAFPSSVGVNPSHTIAALAERNVEAFLSGHLEGERRAMWLKARQAAKTAAAEWVRDFEKRGHSIDPLRNHLEDRSKPPKVDPVGIHFEETMVGFVAPVEENETLRSVADSFAVADIDVGAYLAAQHRGRKAGTSLELKLEAKAVDLRYFLDRPPHQMALTGTARFVRSGAAAEPRAVTGTLELMGSASGRRTMTYELYLVGEDARAAGPWLRGFKEVSDHVGADAYADTTTLYVAFTEDDEAWGGVVRVPLDAFVEKQLPSVKATGTDDPAARAWALAEFGGFFFGHLAHTYAADMIAVAKSVGRRWTGQARALSVTQDNRGGKR